MIFSEWEAINLRKNTKNIKVQRTEYTFDEIYENTQKKNGKALRRPQNEPEQIDLFSFLDEEIETQEEVEKEMQYIPVKIIDVYKEEMEEV